MRIYLNKNWATPTSLGNDNGIYVGRKDELSFLQTHLENRNSSILISGVRGVGKTSFVYKAINNLEQNSLKQNSKIKIAPITINATSLFYNDDLGNGVVKTIIKSLYANTKDKIKDKHLEDLYKKCFTEYLKTEAIEEQEINEKQDETKISFEWQFIFPPIIATIGAIVFSSFSNMFAKILGGVLLSSSTTPFLITKAINKKKTKTKELDASEIYKHDNSTENLLHDLTTYLQQKSTNYKFIFIIDELDKIGNGKAIDLIKQLKNFLNFSSASYVFISDQELYKDIYTADRNDSINATLFTHFLYLSDSKFSDLLEYLKLVTEKFDINEIEYFPKVDNELYEHEDLHVIYNYLLYKSKLDFFELKKLIGGLLHISANGEEYIDSDEFEQFESENDIKRKNCIVQVLHQVLDCYKYGQFMYQQKNQDNQKFIFNFLEKTYNKNYTYDTTKNTVLIPEFKDNNSYIDTSSNHIFALLESLTRFSILEYDNVENPRGYKWSGQFPSDITKIKIDSLLPQEREYVSLFEKYIDLVGDIFDLCNNRTEKKKHFEIKEKEDCSTVIGINAYNDYKTQLKTYRILKKNIPGKISIDIINQGISLFDSCIHTILEKRCLQICSEIIKQRISLDNIKMISITDTTTLPQILGTNSKLRSHINGNQNYVIYNSDFSKQIIITKDFDYNSLSDDIKERINEQSQTTYFVNVVTNASLKDLITYNKITKDKKGNDKTEIITIRNNYFHYIFDNNYWSLLKIIESLENNI